MNTSEVASSGTGPASEAAASEVAASGEAAAIDACLESKRDLLLIHVIFLIVPRISSIYAFV